MKILVTGGSGVIGRAAIEELLHRGHTVRLLTRGAEDAADEWPENVEAFPGDVADASSIRGSADGCDVIVHVAGIVEEEGDATFDAVNVGGTRNMLAETARADAGRFVFVSSLGAERGESNYHRSKRAAERLVEQSALEWVVLRPGSVFGPGDQAISLLLRMVRMLPAIPVIEQGNQPFQPVWHDDVAWAIAEAAERHDVVGQSLDLAGGETTTIDQLLDDFADITDRKPARLPLPAPLVRIATEVASVLGIDIGVKPATLTMLLEGNTIPDGQPNGLTDVLGRRTRPVHERLRELAATLPEQTPEDGVGPLHRRRFRARIAGSKLSAAELHRRLTHRFDDFVSFDAEAEPGVGSRLDPGETLSLELPLRGHAQVRVEEVGEDTVTLGTIEGHPLAGTVRFRLDEPDPGVVRFTIDIVERAATRVDQLSMALGGRSAQRRTWTSTVERMIEVSGGTAENGVEHESWTVPDDQAEELEDWVRDRINERLRSEHASHT